MKGENLRQFTEDDKVDLCYAISDLCNLIEHLFEKQLIPYSIAEWAYNSKCNAQNTLQSVKDKPVVDTASESNKR